MTFWACSTGKCVVLEHELACPSEILLMDVVLTVLFVLFPSYTPLHPWVIAHKDGTVQAAHCDYMAGLGQTCSFGSFAVCNQSQCMNL